MDLAQHVELAAVARTVVESCPLALQEMLGDTPVDNLGAKDWSCRPNVGARKDY